MKKTLIAITCMSFILLMACSSFEQTNEFNMASQATMTIPGGTVQLSGNAVWVQAATTRTNVSEQYLLLKIVCTTGQIDTEPRILRIKGTAATFNIQNMVDVPTEHQFAYTETELGEVHGRAGNISSFTLTVGESYVYENEYLEEWTDETKTVQILNGKLSKLERAILASESETFFSYYIEDGRFLSTMAGTAYAPKTIVVNNVTDPVKMWFSFFGIVSLPEFCKVSISYTDGTGEEAYIPINQLSQFGLIEINCHQMAINKGNPAKTIAGYTVTMHNFGIESKIGVTVLNEYSANHQVLYFLNRFGVVETINCYGELQEDASSETEQYTKQEPTTPSLTDATIESVRKGSAEKFKINTGYKTLEERRWIKDLLLSPYPQVWMRSANLPWLNNDLAFGFAPVVVTPGSWTINTTSEDILNIEIEVQIAHLD